ncbi:MAG: beta-aspartyl-peptidase [Rhodothermales bacterium]
MLDLLLNADVYAPAPLGRRHLLVGGGTILYVGEERPEVSGPDVRVTDLGGWRLLPGFIDGHAHLTGGGGEAGPQTKVPPVALSAFTSAGVTTAVGVLGTDDLTRTTSELVTRVRALRAEGLSAFCHTGGYHLPPATLTGSVKSDIVHIDCVIGVGEVAISDHRSSQPTLEEIARLASEAHVAGLMTGKAGIVHFHLGDGPRGLDLIRRCLDETEIPARVFNPTHVNRRKALFTEACELTKRGCTIDVTAFPKESDDEWSAGEAVRRYLDLGLPPGKITVSSDGGGCLPKFDADGRVTSMGVGRASELMDALRELLRAGRPLEAVLPAFTSNVATLLRLSSKGRIAAGLDADLVVLDPDAKVHGVMACGTWHVRDGEQVVRGTFE